MVRDLDGFGRERGGREQEALFSYFEVLIPV